MAVRALWLLASLHAAAAFPGDATVLRREYDGSAPEAVARRVPIVLTHRAPRAAVIS